MCGKFFFDRTRIPFQRAIAGKKTLGSQIWNFVLRLSPVYTIFYYILTDRSE